MGRQVGPPPSEAALPGQPVLGYPEKAPPVARQPEACQPVVRPPVVCQPVLHQPVVCPPVVCQPVLCQPVVCQSVVRHPGRHSSTVVVPLPPARLERAHSNPLTPGTPVCPARYPDRPEPIKLNYKKYKNAQSTGWRSCG